MSESLTVCPLERFVIARELDGSEGTNRGPLSTAQIEANDDKSAIEAFLQEYRHSSGTQRVYRKEVERLLLWAVLVRKKPISSLTREDFDQYVAFLVAPEPRKDWCGPRAPRNSERWRPFVDGLQEDALLTALAAVNSMLKWWADAGYLNGNPLGLVRQKRRQASVTLNARPLERHLDSDMWQATQAALDALPVDTPLEHAKAERARFALNFLYLMAPRAGELESHRMNSFLEVRGAWWWQVTGKGDKEAKVPVPDDMVDVLVRYRTFLGLPAVPTRQDTSPLLMSAKDMVALQDLPTSPAKKLVFAKACPGLTARQLNRILKEVFAQAASLLPAELAHKGEQLRNASAHWGRHTSITARVDAGMQARYVQKDARHSDARTTALYTHEEDEAWHAEAQKLRLPSKARFQAS